MVCGNQTMNTRFTGPTNSAKESMLACLGQNAHLQLSADHALFILSTTLLPLNSSCVHILGLSFLNILHYYYLSFSLCVYVLFIDISITRKYLHLPLARILMSSLLCFKRLASALLTSARSTLVNLFFRRFLQSWDR